MHKEIEVTKMNNELKEIRMGLDSLNKALKLKKQLEKHLSVETKYVTENMCEKDIELKRLKPQEVKRFDNLITPEKPKRNLLKALLLIGIHAIIFLILHNGVLFQYLLSLPKIFDALIGLIYLIRVVSTLAIPYTVYKSIQSVKLHIDDCKIYNEKLKEYEKKKNYMEIEYPTLEKEYQKQLEIYNQKYKEVYDIYYSENEKQKTIWKQQLEELTTKMKPIEGIISDKYYNNLDSIIDIIDSGRASSLKEAINVFHSDEYQRERISEARQLREAQEESNRIAQWEAEERIRNERKHQENMERYQQELQDSMERSQREQEKRERDAGNAQCYHCKRASHCSYATMSANTGHCAAFIPSTLL